jgi:hypothetical protein
VNGGRGAAREEGQRRGAEAGKARPWRASAGSVPQSALQGGMNLGAPAFVPNAPSPTRHAPFYARAAPGGGAAAAGPKAQLQRGGAKQRWWTELTEMDPISLEVTRAPPPHRVAVVVAEGGGGCCSRSPRWPARPSTCPRTPPR